jgi:hypothetical protein
VVKDVHVEFTLMGKAGEGEIAGAEKPNNGIDWVLAEAEVEFGVKRMAKEKLHDDLPGFELSGQATKARLILVTGSAKGELCAEIYGQPALQADNNLIAYLLVVRQKAVGLAKFLLRESLHADEKAALLPVTAGPPVNECVNRLPTPEIEVADTEIGSI